MWNAKIDSSPDIDVCEGTRKTTSELHAQSPNPNFILPYKRGKVHCFVPFGLVDLGERDFWREDKMPIMYSMHQFKRVQSYRRPTMYGPLVSQPF